MDDDVALLGGVPLFGALPVDLLTQVAQAAETVAVGAGELLFRQGDRGETLYIVRSGRLEVLVDDEIVRVHGRGEAFGELALLSGGVRTASVRARRDSDLLALHRAEFDRLLDTEPAFSRALIHELGARLRRGDVPVARPQSSTVLSLLTVQELPESVVLGLADRLTVELARHATVARVDGGEPRESWGERLDALEAAHEVVLLVAARRAGPWWEFCARQTDRALVVVDPAASDPVPTTLPGAHLVALGTAGLAGWLDAIEPAAHHLVDPASHSDIARLARRVSGRALGLVLSGGGARGLAHLGVIDVLLRAGARIDRVGGTSMGALMAGLVAVGLDIDEMLRVVRHELVERKPFSDYTVSRYGLIRAKRGAAMLERVFGDLAIEAQRRSFFAVSVDLVGAEVVVHRRGRFVDAIGLSVRLPGVAPPAWVDGRLHIDGGVLDNLPIGVMASDGEGPVVAVDVMRPFQPVPGDETVPTAVDTIARAMVLASWQRAASGRLLAHTLITPGLDTMGMFDFRRMGEIVDAGRRSAESALPGLAGLL
ncbi:patatin-like phospholipase family protein [Actinokineospora alba]|nr:patatin-like phospholipase family protein [Actinokineospora alba]